MTAPAYSPAIHATAAMGTVDAMIEYRCFDLEAQLYGSVLAPQRGRISVPQAPGLGIDPDPNVVRACLLAPSVNVLSSRLRLLTKEHRTHVDEFGSP
jgi:L-alanine-DL-glutamate epimerase-like enolase superfamily enzyme